MKVIGKLMAAGVIATVVGCGGASDEPSRAAPTGPKDGGGNSSDAKGLRVVCADHERRFEVVDGSTASWTVVKQGGIPAIGRHAVAGKMATTSEAPFGDTQAKLTFGLDGAFSDLPLRDERLRKHVFASWEGHGLAFTVTSIRREDAKDQLPDSGMSVQATVEGTLGIAGTEQAVTIPVIVTGLDAGLRIASGLDGIKLDLRKDLALGERVDALMAVVDGHLEGDVVRIGLDVELQDACE